MCLKDREQGVCTSETLGYHPIHFNFSIITCKTENFTFVLTEKKTQQHYERKVLRRKTHCPRAEAYFKVH